MRRLSEPRHRHRLSARANGSARVGVVPLLLQRLIDYGIATGYLLLLQRLIDYGIATGYLRGRTVQRAERWQGDDSELHGRGGFLTTSPMSERPAVCQAIIDAAGELGVEYRPDVNNLPPGAGDSIGWCQQTRGGPCNYRICGLKLEAQATSITAPNHRRHDRFTVCSRSDSEIGLLCEWSSPTHSVSQTG
jgi:hypothetical protein